MFGADGVDAGGLDAGATGASSGAGATGAGAPCGSGQGSSASLAGALAASLDRLIDADPHELSDGELADAMVELRREQARLAAVVAAATAEFDARQVHAEDGSRTAADWLAVRCRIPRGQAGRQVREARRLRAMPATRTAFGAGVINPAHVQTLCRLAGHPRAGQHFAKGEADLVDHATGLRFDDWQQLTEHWLAAADPDGPEHKRRRDQDLRRFAVPVGLDGVGHPDGYLTPLAAETVNEALARIERELFETDWNEARALHGDSTTVAHLARTAGQRRHDALIEMAVRAMTAPADGQRPAPLLTVMVDYPTLAGRVCELAGSGTVIAPGDITQLLAQDETLIERVVFDGPTRLRDISTARTFRGTFRRVLETTHRRCDHPSCHVPAKDCQADHIVPWSEGGITSQANGRLACGFHNRLWYHNPHLRPDPPVALATGNTDPPDEPGRDPAPDTAPRHAAPPDSSPLDSSPLDSSPLDSSPLDSSPLDSSPPDAGASDVARPDPDPPQADPPDGPGRDPAHHQPDHDELAGTPAAPAAAAIHPTRHARSWRTRPRPPDLIVTIDNARYAITINT